MTKPNTTNGFLGQAPSPTVPVPDPTLLTTAQVQREINTLKELVFARLDGMDKAVDTFNEGITRVPTDTDKQIQHLRELHDEKFRSIATQFSERDTRTEQTSRDSKVAVDAALQAAKEAVGEQNKSNSLANAKMETAFTKQIDTIGTMIQTNMKATDDKINDMKERLDRGDNYNNHNAPTHQQQNLISILTGGIVGLLVAAITIGVFMAVHK
jgi:hypothetical protein